VNQVQKRGFLSYQKLPWVTPNEKRHFWSFVQRTRVYEMMIT
jgi:hypothetical protein